MKRRTALFLCPYTPAKAVADNDRLIAGYRRLTAAKQLGWNHILVTRATKLDDALAAMKAYAIQAKDKQLEIDASEIRIRAERRLE